MASMSSSQSGSKRDMSRILTAPLSGVSQKLAVSIWVLVTIASLVSLTLSIYSLNLWDRTPAAETSRYFSDITPETVQYLVEWQNTIHQTGLTLSGYAFIFTAARFIGGLSLFIVGFLLIRRYNNRVLFVLMATILPVFAATGIWYNRLFEWAVAIAPWMEIPVQLLGLVVWLCGPIVLYAFPNGRFIPRWMVWLVVLLIPLGFLLVLDIDIFLNPNNWLAPWDLLPEIFLIGAALFSVIYRYMHMEKPVQRKAFRSYAIGISLLFVDYLIIMSLNIYSIVTGDPVFQGNQARLVFIIVNELIWFSLEVIFSVGLALSVFRDKLLEEQV